MNNVLIIAPHPDDETLGCGGTLMKYKEQGYKIYWLLCSRFYRFGKTKESIRAKDEELSTVERLYGFEKRFELGYEAATLTYSDLGGLIGKISKIVNETKPEIILLPNRSDVHSDHQLIFKAGYSCTKNFNFPFIKKVLMYETISETEFAPSVGENYFLPNFFVDVSVFFDRKIKVMELYKSELMTSYYPRNISSIEALGRYRGSAIGIKYAEAYMLLKEIY